MNTMPEYAPAADECQAATEEKKALGAKKSLKPKAKAKKSKSETKAKAKAKAKPKSELKAEAEQSVPKTVPVSREVAEFGRRWLDNYANGGVPGFFNDPEADVLYSYSCEKEDNDPHADANDRMEMMQDGPNRYTVVTPRATYKLEFKRLGAALTVVGTLVDETAGEWEAVAVSFKEGEADIITRLDPTAALESASAWGREFRFYLSRLGYDAKKSATGDIASYILSARQVVPRLVPIHHPGWIEDDATGEVVGCLRMDGEGAPDGYMPVAAANPDDRRALAANGSLEEWSRGVGAWAGTLNTSALMMMASFAPRLLRFTSLPGFGFHFYGESGVGKTYSQRVAASVWGGRHFIGTWRGTDNSLENVAFKHNDLPMFLDEIKEIDPKALSAAIYMLGNGEGKKRMRADSTERRTLKWRTGVVSTGEFPTEDFLARGKEETDVGQLVRLINIRADRMDAAPAITNPFKDCGLAGDAFTRAVERMGDDELRSRAEEAANAVKAASGLNGGQYDRAFAAFGLCAAAGDICVAEGLLPWNPSRPLEAAVACAKAWLDDMGASSPGSAELKRDVARLEAELEMNAGLYRTREQLVSGQYPRPMHGWVIDSGDRVISGSALREALGAGRTGRCARAERLEAAGIVERCDTRRSAGGNMEKIKGWLVLERDDVAEFLEGRTSVSVEELMRHAS